MSSTNLVESFRSRCNTESKITEKTKPARSGNAVASSADVVQSTGDARSVPSESDVSPLLEARHASVSEVVVEIQQDNSLCLHPTEKNDFDWLIEDASLLAVRDGWPVFVQKLTPPSKRYTNDLNVWFRGAAAVALVHLERCEEETIDSLLRSELRDIAWWRANWETYKRAETAKGCGWTHEAANLLRKRAGE